MLFMLLPHKLHIRLAVIDVGNEKLWLSGGLRIFVPGFVNSDQLAQKFKYEHQRSYLVVALKTMLEREVDYRNWM